MQSSARLTEGGLDQQFTLFCNGSKLTKNFEENLGSKFPALHTSLWTNLSTTTARDATRLSLVESENKNS